MKMAMIGLAGLLAALLLSAEAAQGRLRRSQGKPMGTQELMLTMLNSTSTDDPDTDGPESDFQNLEEHVLKMAGSKHSAAMDEGLKTVETLIIKTLLPGIVNTSNATQKELDQMISAFVACGSPKSDVGELKQLSDARPPKVANHKVCRAAQEQAWGENDECNTLLASLKMAMDASCGALAAVKRNPADAKSQCNPAPGQEYGDWLDHNAGWFVAAQKEYKDLESKCKIATANYNARVPVCAGKATALKAKQGECNTVQTGVENSYCSFQASVVTTCKNYGACYDAAMKKFSQRKPVIVKEEVSRKINWQVLNRIVCLLDVLAKDGKDEDIQKCKDTNYDTTLLNLKYTDPPSEQPCATLGPMPCGDDFVTAVYSGLPQHAQAAECNYCPGGAPPIVPNFEVASPSGTEICAASKVYEFSTGWECPGNDIISFPVPVVGQSGWRDKFLMCAQECANRDSCAAFNYPSDPKYGSCFIKSGFQNSPSRGWKCGGVTPGFNFFTKIPGRKCTSPPRGADWSIPVGIQLNYALSNLPKSWAVSYDVTYGTTTVWENIDPGRGDCMLIGAKPNAGSTTFSVVAFGRRSVITSSGNGVWENSVYFYRVPQMSAGFADSNALALNQADTMSQDSPKRLSWHLNLNTGGWRAGTTLWLNGDPTWRKVIMYGPCVE